MGCHYAPKTGLAKLHDLSAFFLVVLTLLSSYHGLAAGQEEMLVVDLDVLSTSADSVMPRTFLGWSCKPKFTWWPVGFCAWNFSTTGIWQITFAGKACDGGYGARLANYARTTMTSNRSFRSFVMGVSPATSTVICAKGSTAGQVTYTIQVQAPRTPAGRQMMQRLRSGAGGGLARNMFTFGSMRSIGLFKGRRRLFQLL